MKKGFFSHPADEFQLAKLCRQLLRQPLALFNPQLSRLHTAPARQAPPVILVLLMKPVMKLATALTARTARRQWRKVKPETKAKVHAYFSARRRWFIAGGASCCVGCLGYYAWHVDRAPFTGRLRIVTISHDRLNEYSKLELNNILESSTGFVHPAEHPYTRRVAELMQSLFPAAKRYFPDLPKDWHIYVIENDSMVNAMCLSTGDIFVYSGMLKFVENDDQLAFVLAHELSHVLIGHSREILTISNALYSLLLLPLTALTWYFVPDFVAAFGYVIQEKLVHICFHLPFSRRLELEADAVGLDIAAASCYDPAEAARFWELMDYMEEASESRTPEFISTHPLSADRARILRDLQQHAASVRSACGCRPIGPRFGSPAERSDAAYKLLRGAMLSFASRLSGRTSGSPADGGYDDKS